MLDAGVEILLKAFDHRRILVGILIDDLRCTHLGNLRIRLVEHRTNLWIQLVDDFLRQFVANVLQLVVPVLQRNMGNTLFVQSISRSIQALDEITPYDLKSPLSVSKLWDLFLDSANSLPRLHQLFL